MAKYIIEIEDKPKNGLYKAKRFRTLVFDEEGLSRLEKVKERKSGLYFYVTDNFEVRDDIDRGTEADLMRKEVGNYYETYEKADHVRNRMLEFLGWHAPDDYSGTCWYDF